MMVALFTHLAVIIQNEPQYPRPSYYETHPEPVPPTEAPRPSEPQTTPLVPLQAPPEPYIPRQ